MGLDGGQDRVDPLHFLEVGLNLQTGPVPWNERKSVRRLIRRVVEPEALRAEIGVGGVGNDLGMAGSVCRWAVFFRGDALLLACSVVVELLSFDRMSPMSLGCIVWNPHAYAWGWRGVRTG